MFSGWIYLKRRLRRIDPSLEVVLDLSRTRLVDHTVMEKLHVLELEYEHAGRALHVVGLEGHRRLSDHPHAARKKAVLEASGGAA